MNYLIVGLGNIGDEYEGTPQHGIQNIGRSCKSVQYCFPGQTLRLYCRNKNQKPKPYSS